MATLGHEALHTSFALVRWIIQNPWLGETLSPRLFTRAGVGMQLFSTAWAHHALSHPCPPVLSAQAGLPPNATTSQNPTLLSALSFP